jgi:GNAT superfamily N-acetyltransferase
MMIQWWGMDALLGRLPAGGREFIPKSEDPAAWARLHAFRLAMHTDLHPEDAFEPDAVAEVEKRRPDPFWEPHHYVLERDGRVVSKLWLSFVLPGNPEYESNRQHIEMDIKVLPEYRRQGIATSWLPLVKAFGEAHDARLVSVDADSEPGLAFLDHIGAEPKLRSWDSRLWFDRANWDEMRAWAAIDPGANRLERYEPFPPEELLETYAPNYSELSLHVPKEEADIGDWILTPDRMREDRERMAQSRRTLHVLAAWDDRGMSGVTEMIHSEHDPEALEQELTAVHPRARGHGLAKLLKARLVLELRDRYPQVRFVRTYNAGSNDAMWGINAAMGFVRHRLDVLYQIEVGRL